MPPKKASRMDSPLIAGPPRAPGLPRSLRAARDAVFVAREAGGVCQLERMQALRQRLREAGGRLVNQDRADVDALRSHHPARGALKLLRLFPGQVPAAERLPGFVSAQPLLLRSDAEERQHFEPGTRQADPAEPLEKTRSPLRARPLAARLRPREDRVQAAGREVPDAEQDLFEGSGPADRIVRLRRIAVDRDPDAEGGLALLG